MVRVLVTILLITVVNRVGVCQISFLDNLTHSIWTSDVKITDFNIGQLKEIRLSKLKGSHRFIEGRLFDLVFFHKMT